MALVWSTQARSSCAAPVLAAMQRRPAAMPAAPCTTTPRPQLAQPQAALAPSPRGSPIPRLCQALDRRTAEQYLRQLDGWEIREDRQGRLHLMRTYRCSTFAKALVLCNKIAAVAEAEGHHPDLHITEWNRLTVSVFTLARNGLTEIDAMLASKVDRINKKDLIKPAPLKRFAQV